MKQLVFYIMILSPMLGLSQKNQTGLKNSHSLKWLVGSWKGMNGDKPFFEAWKFFNDSVLVNFEITVNNGDTSVRESNFISLQQNQKIYGNKTIQWKISRITDNELVLKNDSLPYSNTIIWLHTKNDHWFAILENPTSTIYYDLEREYAIDRKVEEWIRVNKR